MPDILIINQREGEAIALATTLQNAGYRTIHASDIENIHTVLGGIHPALVILGTTGQHPRTQTHLLQSHPATKKVPIVLQSNDFSAYNPDYLRWVGAVAAIGNLTSAARLLDHISSLIRAVR